jgi:hypothetical protein
MGLDDPKLQGLGALAGIAAFVLAAYLAFGQSAQPTSQSTVPIASYHEVNSPREETADKPSADKPSAYPSRGESEPDGPHVERRNESTPIIEPASPKPEIERGGVSVSTSGFHDVGTDLESAVIAALGESRWSGLRHGGPKQLRISGTLSDAAPTLNRIPTARASATWELQLAAGSFLAQGAVSDRLGTGSDQPTARISAIRRVGREVADQIAAEVP